MLNNPFRHGNFTSSEIVALTSVGSREMTDAEKAEHKKLNPKSKKTTIPDGFGDAAITYIIEKNMERQLGCSLDTETNAKPLQWGKLLESNVFELLGLDYTLTSTETDVHPEIDYWAGSKDGTREGAERAVIDIKCPYTRKSFIQLVQPLYHGLTGIEAMNAIRNGYTHNGVAYPKHKEGETYYWQLVSNAIINGTDWAELIVYMPYLSELDGIRRLAEGVHMWLWASADCELPYLPDNGYFKNLNVIRFQVPPEDKEFLTERVNKAGQLLIPRSSILIAHHDEEVDATIVDQLK